VAVPIQQQYIRFFVLAGLATSVWQLIVLYTVLAVFTSGIQPIATMYALEYHEGQNWRREIVKYNSYWNVGTIFGLVVNSILLLVVPLNWLLYVSSIFCLVSTLIL
jgi:MFS family permease